MMMCEANIVSESFKDDRDWYAIMNFAAYRCSIAKNEHQKEFWMSVFNRISTTFGDGNK